MKTYEQLPEEFPGDITQEAVSDMLNRIFLFLKIFLNYLRFSRCAHAYFSSKAAQ